MNNTAQSGAPSESPSDFITRQVAEVERLTAENAALRKDAERYRFMREHTSVTVGPSYVLRSTEELDSAIDAAMEQGHE
jgi:predicted lipase